MMPQQRHKKKVAGVFCALLLAFFFESSFCAAVRALEHAATDRDCAQAHEHDGGCAVSNGSTPCPEGCNDDIHLHGQMVAATTKDPSTASTPLLAPSVPLPSSAQMNAAFHSVPPVTLALPPPELQRTTVLLI